MDYTTYQQELQIGNIPKNYDIFFDLYLKKIVCSIKEQILLFALLKFNTHNITDKDIAKIKISNITTIGTQLAKLINEKQSGFDESAINALTELANSAYTKFKTKKFIPTPYIKIKNLDISVELIKVIKNIIADKEPTYNIESNPEQIIVYGLKRGILTNYNGWSVRPIVNPSIEKWYRKQKPQTHDIVRLGYEIKNMKIYKNYVTL